MKAVIFDMDGVLIDSEPLYEQHLKTFLVTLGVSDPEKLQRSLKGKSSKDISAILIETFSLTHNLDELTQISRQAYLDYLNAQELLPPIPGAKELVEHLHRAGHPIALASSASNKRIKLFLDKLGLEQYFKLIASGEDVKRSKPAPDIFLLAADLLGKSPEECVVIEDAWNGVQAAKAAGMKCIAYSGSIHNSDDLSDADLIVKDFTALAKALKPGLLPV